MRILATTRDASSSRVDLRTDGPVQATVLWGLLCLWARNRMRATTVQPTTNAGPSGF